LKHVGAVKVF